MPIGMAEVVAVILPPSPTRQSAAQAQVTAGRPASSAALAGGRYRDDLGRLGLFALGILGGNVELVARG